MFGPRRICYRQLGVLVCLVAGLSTSAGAQSPVPGQHPQQLKPPNALALPPATPSIHRQLTGSGFFADETGHVLTAAHVVVNCARVMITKEHRHAFAKLVARSSGADLALLKAPRTLGLAAVFPRSVIAAPNDMVFAGAYDKLAELRLGGGLLANATVTGEGEGGALALVSPARPGASGAPVLDRFGLVQGVISRRTATDRVMAVSVATAKAFLLAHGVRIAQDDRPQLDGSASRADRAASISVRVTCLQE